MGEPTISIYSIAELAILLFILLFYHEVISKLQINHFSLSRQMLSFPTGYEALQTLEFGNGFSLSLAMGILPHCKGTVDDSR